ncbi:MAG: hypothetical protein ACE5IR_17725 [bacterium]
MKKVILLSLLLFVSCEDRIVDPEATARIGAPFWLKLGKEAVVQPENITVAFQQLVTDFRCPIGRRCDLPGHAEVRMSLSDADLDSINFRLVIGDYVSKADTMSHPSVDALGYRVTLMQLDPHPRSDEQHQISDYKALLKISRLSL